MEESPKYHNISLGNDLLLSLSLSPSSKRFYLVGIPSLGIH